MTELTAVLRRRKQRRASAMTVGIAAKAEGGQAIVVVLDKQRTNDQSGLRIDDVDVKGFRLDNGWLMFYAQDGTFARSVWVEANRQLAAIPQPPEDVDDIRGWIVRAYEKVYPEHADVVVFSGHFFNRQKYVDRAYDLPTVQKIDALIEGFDQANTADLLVCGFDARGDGQIVKVVAKSDGEVALSMAAIGIGHEVAEQHLAYRKASIHDRLPQVVYKVFEAKVHSENAYIGEPTDAYVLFRAGAVHLSDNTKDELRSVFARYDKMPMDAVSEALTVYERPTETESAEEWARVLVEDKLGPVLKQIEYARTVGRSQAVPIYRVREVGTDAVFGSTPSSVPIETVPPSSQLPNDGQR